MSTLASDSMVFARRNLAHVRQIPEKLLDVTAQPVMFVLLFNYVFGGAIAIPGGDYTGYLIGGILVQSLAFGMMGPGVAIATDLTEGVIERFRAMPVRRSAYLLGHYVSEQLASILAITVLSLTALTIGWHIDSDLAHALAGFGLLLLFSATMICAGTLVGLSTRSPDAVQGVMFMVMFPLTFVSNVFVPTASLPAALETFANWNPVSAVATAVRTLFGNPTATPDGAPWPLQHPVVAAVSGCLILLAILVPAVLRRYRSRTTG